MKINFGQHKGKHLNEIPRDYLEWLLRDNVRPHLNDAINKILLKPKPEPVYLHAKNYIMDLSRDTFPGFKTKQTVRRLIEELEEESEVLILLGEKLGHKVIK
jgi:hypothetical protein